VLGGFPVGFAIAGWLLMGGMAWGRMGGRAGVFCFRSIRLFF